MKYLLSITAMLIIILMGTISVSAQGPTATPTLRPIPPSPTSAYLYLRPTPTPLTINVNPANFPIQTDAGGLADLAINMYRYINRDHIVDFIGTGILVVVCVSYLVRMSGRTTREL